MSVLIAPYVNLSARSTPFILKTNFRKQSRNSIDCALCEPECPVDAIYSEDELPEAEQEFLELNAELCETWPNITEKKDPLPDAEDWAEVKNKRDHLAI